MFSLGFMDLPDLKIKSKTTGRKARAEVVGSALGKGRAPLGRRHGIEARHATAYAKGKCRPRTGKDGDSRRLVRDRLSAGRFVAYRIGRLGAVGSGRNLRRGRAWGNRKAVRLRLVRCPLERGADRTQPQDWRRGADPASSGHGL